MIVTYKNDKGLEIDADDEEYPTSHLHRSKFLNYGSSVIKDKSFANGHFQQSNEAPNDSYKLNLQGFDKIKAVADDWAHLGLINKKELAIYLAMDCITSTNDLPIDYDTKFSSITNPKWATDMYAIYGQDAIVEDYLKLYFMDEYIKKEDYLYITTG